MPFGVPDPKEGPSRARPHSPPSCRVLDVAIPVYNEENTIRGALDSLRGQDLPPDVGFGSFWVIASGCTDRTVERVRDMALRDPRIHLHIEDRRTGKSSALAQIWGKIDADYLLMMDGDSRALPGSLRALLERARRLPPPLAVMGCPVPPRDKVGYIDGEIQLLYGLHHAFHDLSVNRRQTATHLSDNLLLLSARPLPPLPPYIVNEGSWIGTWLRARGGHLAYVPEARVEIEIPRDFFDHLAQRRRIHWGHRQVGELTGQAVSTLQSLLFQDPLTAVRMTLGTARRLPHGGRRLATLFVGEVLAHLMALWDQYVGHRDHIRWTVIKDSFPRGSTFSEPLSKTANPLRGRP